MPHVFPFDPEVSSLSSPKPILRAWADAIDLTPILGKEADERWHRSFDWNKKTDVEAHLTTVVLGIQFDPAEATKALELLNARGERTLRDRLGGPASKAIVAARPFSDLTALSSLEGVTAATVETLRSWVRSTVRWTPMFG